MNPNQQAFRETTKEICARHGYTLAREFEYECNETTGSLSVPALKIWIGRGRSKRGMRRIELTEQDQQQIIPVINAMRADETAIDTTLNLPQEMIDWIDSLTDEGRLRALKMLNEIRRNAEK